MPRIGMSQEVETAMQLEPLQEQVRRRLGEKHADARRPNAHGVVFCIVNRFAYVNHDSGKETVLAVYHLHELSPARNLTPVL